MATNNITFPIYNADGTPFNGLVLRNAAFDSVVMSLGDKITGDVYYKDNTLAVTMSEYIEYKRNEDSEAVKFVLVNPPTVVREGIVSDNSELRGMTKYSFVFYHPMYAVSNFPFTDVAVSSDEQKYLSNSKTFNWIGNLFDMVAKLNKNLQGTQWVVGTNIEHYEQDGVTETSMWQKAAKIPDEPLSFDKTYVSEVLKTSYETWEIPFIVDQIAPTDALYAQGKRFLILFGTPSNEILDDQDEPYIFRFGQGVGLKNNSRTPKNNKIVTRIVGYGGENNIPFGYPQIQWFGDQTWKYTINNQSGTHEITLPGGRTVLATSYTIYKGILGGQYVNLIKHPFTRKTLMPSVYRETLFNKVSPYMPDGTLNQNFDPTIELVDYYDADSSYVNPVVQGAESVEIHQFEDIKPEFTEHSIVGISAYDGIECISISEFNTFIQAKILASNNENEKSALQNVYDNMFGIVDSVYNIGGSYTYLCEYGEETEYTSGVWQSVKYTSSGVSFTYNVYNGSQPPSVDVEWDDTMDDDGKYKQSYFKMTLPQLDFDLYACASITEEMKINMRSGACIGCTFPIYVDWDDYKKNFYDSDGNFLPDGEQRNLTKYPKTNLGQVTFVVNKDLDTFGTLMPNTYQKPYSGDEFVILGISLPTTYVTNAEARLDDAAKEYMRENNVHYYEYPLKFDEHFLATHVDILSQIRNNTIVRFQYGVESPMALYVKQITVKYSGVLPTYDITLADDVEIVLNQIGQVTDDVSRMRVQMSELQKYYSENIIQSINEKLSKVVDDVCQGRITFQQGLDSIGSAIFHDELRSPDFTSGLYTGRGWRVDQLGNAELESLRVRSYLEIVELLVNRMQAQEGDTMFSDNDQIDKVDKIEDGGNVSYILSLKEKWSGYVTSQMYGNILKGIINTLAAKQSGVSDVTTNSVYYTSWMRVVDTHNTDSNLGVNQIRVELYNDNETPAGKNFEPCELMTIARWGCEVYNANYSEKYQAEGLATETAARESIKRRQQVFYLSTSEGRIVKLNSVYKPKLEDWNYGTTLGELPEFVKQYSAVAPRLVGGGDYLYAQGVVVGDFIKVDKQGLPMVNYVDKGEWQDNTEYLVNEYNSTTMQYETHDVWHNGSYWRCLVTQPHNGVYYEPTEANNIYWQKLLTSGTSVPFYIKEWYAWSNVSRTANTTTSPFTEPYSGWQTSIPEQGNLTYLWRKSIRYVLNDSNGQYIPDTAQYFRMSGTDGTSINVNGTVRGVAHNTQEADVYAANPTEGCKFALDFDDLTVVGVETYANGAWTFSSASDGDSYTTEDTGHLLMFSSEAQHFLDLGQFQGQSGKTYYTHIAWAISVDTSTTPITVTGFVTTKSPNDTVHIWMGVLVDENSGQDSSDAERYTWSNTKGDNGKTITAISSIGSIAIPCNSSGYSRTSDTKTGTATLYVDGTSATPISLALKSKPSGITVTLHSDVSAIPANGISISWSSNTRRAILDGSVILTATSGEYSCDIVIPILCSNDGIQGERGKIGRFFYFAGVWENIPQSASFVLNDAQAPFFQHTVSGQNRYHVYNPDTNPTGGAITKATMAQTSFNNEPWEVMTNDFKYLITEAIFADFAKLGSFIVSCDWLISTNGTINGTAYVDGESYNGAPSYTWFDPVYPNTDHTKTVTISGQQVTVHNFIPNLAFDGKTGETYQNSAVVRGTIMAENFSQTLALVWSNIKCWTLTPNGEKRTYIYYHTLCTEDWFLEYQENEGKTFNVGDIILYNPDSDTYGDLLYESNFGISEDPQDEEYFSPYIGEASIIQAVNSISGVTTIPKYAYIVIPSAKDYAGKRLEIRNKGTGSLDVYAYKNPNVVHQFYNYIEDYPTNMSGRVFEKINISAANTAVLWSDGTYWVVLEK